jgi:hypothetical protein
MSSFSSELTVLITGKMADKSTGDVAADGYHKYKVQPCKFGHLIFPAFSCCVFQNEYSNILF